MYKIFKLLPKPSNLHIHFSSIVPYKLIIKDIRHYFMNDIYIDIDSNLSFYNIKVYKVLNLSNQVH